MSEQQASENIAADSEKALRQLAWALAASRGEFKLFLARCNSTRLHRRLGERLQQLCAVEIRSLELKETEVTLYGRIQAEVGEEQPGALMVFGLEVVSDRDRLLAGANQVREEFQKNFHFPLVLWVNDEIFKKLARVAPDFESWAISVEFGSDWEELATFVRETAEQWFANTLSFTHKAGLQLAADLQAVRQDELRSDRALPVELESELECLLGAVEFSHNNPDAALEHYQKALPVWQQANHLERQAKLLGEMAFCAYLKVFQERDKNHPGWQVTRYYLQQCLEVLERGQRPELAAKLLAIAGRVLREVQEWEVLQRLAQQALQVHESENKSVELSRDFGWLAEVAIAQQRWAEAQEWAERALQILSTVSQPDSLEISGDRSLYLFILARAQQNCNQPEEALRNLEEAANIGSPEYDTQVYLDILCALQGLYYQQREYLKAFEIKLDRQSIEQQYGLRAFVGAGRIQPQRQAKFAREAKLSRRESQVEKQEKVAPEIATSGRMLDVERLSERIGRNDFKLIVIHGQSGVGKSSLVNGGLVPALKERAIGIHDVLPVSVRVYTNWGEELGRSLSEALVERGSSREVAPNSTEAILEELQRNEQRQLRTVIIFDQFEEFFFVCTAPSERRQFFEFLAACLNIRLVKVILSLREDYLHLLLECDRLEGMKIIGHDILAKNVRYPVGNFSPEDANAIVQRLTERSRFRLDGDLIEALVRDLAGELGEVRPIELQVVGAQLQAENITTLARYREAGSKEEYVKRYLAEVVEACGSENIRAAELLLYLLTDEKGTRPLKTRAELERDLQALAAELSLESSQLDLILEIFVGSGLVLLLPETPADRYQLVHDYLAAFINQQQKPRLNEVIAELKKEREQRRKAEAERQQTTEELERAEKARQILEEANKKAARRIRISAGLLIFSFVAAAVAGVSALRGIQTLQEARKGTELEREGMNTLRTFELQEIQGLLAAMRAGQELKALEKDNRPLENYPTARPMLALQTILDSIWERNQLKGHQGYVNSASFSRDGKRVVTASSDGTARIWDSSGKLVAELNGHQGDVHSASFSPDGERVVTASSDKTARIWRVENLDELLSRGCTWLKDYLVTHPIDLETLEVCQNNSNLTAAALSLVQEGEDEARGGNIEAAVESFRKAREWNPSLKLDAQAKARQLADASELVKKGKELAKAGNIDGAVAEFQKALPLDSSLDFQPEAKARRLAASALLAKGEDLVRKGTVKEALAAYAQAQKFDATLDIYADSWNTLCRYGSLHGSAADVMFACEKAIALIPWGDSLDSRGMARALAGNKKGAIEDFQAYIAWMDSKSSQYRDYYKNEKSQRQRWIAILKAGKNPFMAEELERLPGERRVQGATR